MSTIHDDFGTTLTALFDDVAADIQPRPDFDAVVAGHVTLTEVGSGATISRRSPHRFRRGVAVAAAALLVGGGAAAYVANDGDDPETVVSSEVTADDTTPGTTATTDPGPSTEPAPATTVDAVDTTPDPTRPGTGQVVPAGYPHTAKLGESDLSAAPPKQVVLGTASPGELATVTTPYGHSSREADELGRWKTVVTLDGAQPGERVPLRVTFSRSGDVVELAIEMPEPETTTTEATTTTTEPKPVGQDFTAVLGWTDGDGTPLKVGLWGTAQPGSTISVGSERGSGSVVANGDGKWEIVVELHEMAPGTQTGLRVTSSTSDRVYEFTAKAPPAPDGTVKPFTAELGVGDLAAQPMKQGFRGYGTPGAGVRVGSDYGVVETTVRPDGFWEAGLKAEVPYGVTVHVRVTSSASDSVYEFDLVRPAAAPAKEFTANAAQTASDHTPPINEYWGTATPGTAIWLQSPYGSTNTTAGADGTWSARIEFPDAPLDQEFIVKVASSQSSKLFEFPMRRVAP